MRKTEWTKEKLQEEVNKYKTRKEFRSNSRNAYLTALNNKIMKELFKNHINNGYCENRKINGYWTKEKLQEESDKYETRQEFRENDINAYSAAKSKKLTDEIFKNHPNQGYVLNHGWTEEKLQEEVNKYKTRKNFRNNSTC